MNDPLDKAYYELPEVIKYLIADYLPTTDLVKLKAPNKDLIKTHQSFFKPLVEVRIFLDAVVNCEHDKVKALLKDNIDLLLQKSAVTDFSRRGFEQINGFEYALWALDKHMWATILECIPQNEAGQKVLEQLRVQYAKVKAQGITFTLNGQVITESHFDLQNTLIKELKTLHDFYDTPGPMHVNALNKQWIEGVGGAQKLLPVHVVNEYCAPHNLIPAFNSSPKPSKIFQNWVTDKYEAWFNEDSRLGVDYAVSKGSRYNSIGRDNVILVVDDTRWDLATMEALYRVRTNDFSNLELQLEDSLKFDDEHTSASQR